MDVSHKLDGGAPVVLPLTPEALATLKKALMRAVREGYGTIEIVISPASIRITDKAEYKYTWPAK
jgi:uncharacterized protein YvpB